MTEFGPHNTIYHEGRKRSADSIALPLNGVESLLKSAKLRKRCGYCHDRDVESVEICERCKARLDGYNSEFPQRLLDMPTVRTQPRERISSEEEERVRSGYEVSTHHCPSEQVYAQPDFYYERGRVCAFIDGPSHDAPEIQANDAEVREELEERGFKVIAVRHDDDFAAQIARYPEVFSVDG